MHPFRVRTPAAHSQLEQLAAAIEAHRAGRSRCRLPASLRARVLAAIDAGAPVEAVRKACKLSAWQIASWRQSTALEGGDRVGVPELESPRVLSVVDRAPRQEPFDGEIELRIGGWRVSLRREAP